MKTGELIRQLIPDNPSVAAFFEDGLPVRLTVDDLYFEGAYSHFDATIRSIDKTEDAVLIRITLIPVPLNRTRRGGVDREKQSIAEQAR